MNSIYSSASRASQTPVTEKRAMVSTRRTMGESSTWSRVPASYPVVRLGCGIGRALVRRAVELHSGRVALVSAGRGQGSSFR